MNQTKIEKPFCLVENKTDCFFDGLGNREYSRERAVLFFGQIQACLTGVPRT